MNKTIAIFAFAAAATFAAIPARASTFSVSNNGATFTISRSGDTSAAETVLYRTVPLTAFPGQHYTEKSGTLVFAPGQTSTNVPVTLRTPSEDAYKYQTGSSRTYRFELTDRAGAFLASMNGSVSSGLTQVSQNYVSSSITDLVKFSGTSLTSGMGSSKYYDVSYSPSSNGNHVMTDGYITIDDGYDYDNHTLCTIPTSAFFSQTKGSQDYFDSLGCKLYATVYFTMKEVDDGYQYVQILADNATSKDGKDPDGGVNTPSTSIYKACFELSKGSGSYPKTVTTDHYQAFPHRTDNHTSSTEFDYADAYLYAQAFKDNTPSYRAAKSGSLVLSPKVNAVNVRFDANGSGDDTWLVKNLKVRFALCETTAPTKLGNPVVAPGRYGLGSTFYVSIPFSEIVTVSGTPTLTSDWGTLSYFSGSGSNVLTFKGVIDADYGETLTIRELTGTIKDLAGNSLSTPLNVTKTFSCAVEFPWPGAGTDVDPYIITTTNQLNYLAACVNAGTWFTNTCFVLGADIAYSHATTDWDTITSSGNSENNFTPIGCHGHSFRGTFDGRGHTVSGIRVYASGTTDDRRSVGLFGFVSDGTVKNVFLRDANIRAGTDVGGIVGYLSDGTVTNCLLHHVCVGSDLSNQISRGIIVGNNSGGIVGGCHYRDCCLNTGGGPGAIPEFNVRKDDLFSLAPAADVAAAFVSGETATIDGETYYTEGSTFDLSYGGTLPSACVFGGFSATAGTVSGNAFTMPAADCTVSPLFAPAWTGSGTAEAPYLITTTNELDLLSQMVNGQGGYAANDFATNYFVLGDDIAYTHTTDWNDAASTENNFTAIGSYYNDNSFFCGSFDGDGHTVSGIRIYRNGSGEAYKYQGLFGYVGTGGTVRNLALADARVTGENNVGGLAGVNEGTVENCIVAADVLVAASSTGGNSHGGVVGKNVSGTIGGCTVSATVTASSTGYDYYGAVVGSNTGGSTITNCLAVGATIPKLGKYYGVIVGQNATGSNGILAANYYRACTVGTATNAVNAGVGRSTGAPADRDGARSVHTLTLADGITAAGSEAVLIDSVTYSAAGSAVALAYDGTPAAGTTFAGFVVSTADGNSPFETDGAFAMPAYAAAAKALVLTDWAALNRRLAAGGEVTLDRDYAATAEDGPLTVPQGVTVTLDLNGHVLDRNLAAATNAGYVIRAIGNLTVRDGAPNAVHGGTEMTGGIITGGNNSGNGGGVYIYGGGTSAPSVTLEGGTVTGNAANNGGGVYASGYAFTMTGGAVSNNTAGYGGGVFVNSGTFTLSGGAVSGNTATSYGRGGGVYLDGGTAILSGGMVSENTATYGGGVYVRSGGFTLSDGAVSGNFANYGGGVYLYGGAATLSGGAISGNAASNGGGVYVVNNNGALFQISGGPVVSGNAVGGAPSNVHLTSGKHIDVTGELTASARLGVTAVNAPGVFTEGLCGLGAAENFLSDDPAWRVSQNGDNGEAELFEPQFFDIAIGESALGTVTARVNDSVVAQAAAGDTVVLVGDPAEGYGLRSVVVTNAFGDAVAASAGADAGTFSFVMPAASVGVEATLEAVYPVAIADGILHGTVAADKAAAFAGDVVTLTAVPDEGYAFGSLSVTDVNGDPVQLLTQVGPTAQFEMPVGGVVASSRFVAFVPVPYVDADGGEHTLQAIPLEGWMSWLAEGAYAVTGEVAFAGGIKTYGDNDVTLILADGCALRFGTPEAPLDGCAISAVGGHLAIYGQAGGTGRLEIHNANSHGIYSGDYAQHGGNVLVRTSGGDYCISASGSVVLDGGSLDVEAGWNGDIYAYGSVSILGGRLSASGGGFLSSFITLGHKNPTDSIYAADYYIAYSGGELKVNDGQALTDGTNVYTGRVSAGEIVCKTLTPVYRVSVVVSASGWQGRATAAKDYFAAGETVALTVAADPGYAPVDLTLIYKDTDGTHIVAVTNNQFAMPAGDVTVMATFGSVAFPSYLASADYVVTNNYLAWAAKYGSDTNSACETSFLLDLPPWTAFPDGAAPLRIVEMGVTNIPTAMSDLGYIAMAMGYTGEELPCRRLVLASDVADLKRREDFDTPFEACNGYLVLRIGADLSLPTSEWLAISWLVEFEDGRGEIVFPELFMDGIRSNLERAADKPLNGLFLRPCISPVPHLEWIDELGTLIEGP